MKHSSCSSSGKPVCEAGTSPGTEDTPPVKHTFVQASVKGTVYPKIMYDFDRVSCLVLEKSAVEISAFSLLTLLQKIIQRACCDTFTVGKKVVLVKRK